MKRELLKIRTRLEQLEKEVEEIRETLDIYLISENRIMYSDKNKSNSREEKNRENQEKTKEIVL